MDSKRKHLYTYVKNEIELCKIAREPKRHGKVFKKVVLRGLEFVLEIMEDVSYVRIGFWN